HARIGNIGRAAIEDLMVGRRLMCVGPDNGTHPPIHEMAEAHLLGCRFRMEIDDRRIRLLAEMTSSKLVLRSTKRIVQFRMHEHPAHDIGHEHARPVPGDVETRAATWRTLRKIGGTKETL